MTYSLADSDGFPGETFGVGHALLHDGLKQLLLINAVKRWLRAKRLTKHSLTADL